MTFQIARLTARVTAQNEANRIAIEIFPQLKAAFTPFLGQQLYKVGGFLKKVEKTLPKFENDCQGIQILHNSDSNYSLCYTVRVCKNVIGDYGCAYQSATLYIGKLANGILTKLYESSDYSIDPAIIHTVEGVQQKREAYQQAKEIASNALSALSPFGEYDK